MFQVNPKRFIKFTDVFIYNQSSAHNGEHLGSANHANVKSIRCKDEATFGSRRRSTSHKLILSLVWLCQRLSILVSEAEANALLSTAVDLGLTAF